MADEGNKMMELLTGYGVASNEVEDYCSGRTMFGVEIGLELEDDPYYRYRKIVGIFATYDGAVKAIAEANFPTIYNPKVVEITIGFILSDVYEDRKPIGEEDLSLQYKILAGR